MRRVDNWSMFFWSLAGICSGVFLTGGAASDEGHEADVREWRSDRVERLTKNDGWLTLTGLYWLEEGESTCGSDPESDVVLPAPAPAMAGTVTLADGGAVFEAAPDVEVLIDGEARRRVELNSDTEGAATLVELGVPKAPRVIFHLIDRGGRIGVRVKDREHPALTGFEGIDYYPIDGRWRIEADFEPYDPPRTVPVPTVLGTVNEVPSPGAVVFRMAARELRIDALPADEGRLWLIFGDASNGKETYGGGRFLYADGPDENGRVRVDFNKSYNPPCAFTPYATCPLPPPQNKLKLAVRAGEKNYGHH